MAKVAIIGAGISGLTCAERLTGAGHACTVFEKSRGLGGRLATRRAGDLRFDHGAQYATVRDPDFDAYISSAVDDGKTAVWEGAGRDDPVYVGTPGMSGMVKALVGNIDIRLMSRVLGIDEQAGKKRLMVENKGYASGFDAVVVAVPSPQAIELLSDFSAFDVIGSVEVAPCWAGLFAFDQRLPIETDTLRGGETIAWAARNGSKPGRDHAQEAWVVHASPEWSKTHLENDKDGMAEPLLTAFYAFSGIKPIVPTYASSHRWRYAQTEKPLGQPFVFDDAAGIIACGDWCLGRRIEDGFRSGFAAAKHLETVLDPAPPILPAVGTFG
ncbi:MAG: FAD-dependent oxidoreductase [Pseudomonadota bacterium]